MGTSPAGVAQTYDSLQGLQPDVGPHCKAMVGYCLTLSVSMAACTAVMQRLLDLHHKLYPGRIVPQQLAVEVTLYLVCIELAVNYGLEQSLSVLSLEWAGSICLCPAWTFYVLACLQS